MQQIIQSANYADCRTWRLKTIQSAYNNIDSLPTKTVCRREQSGFHVTGNDGQKRSDSQPNGLGTWFPSSPLLAALNDMIIKNLLCHSLYAQMEQDHSVHHLITQGHRYCCQGAFSSLSFCHLYNPQLKFLLHPAIQLVSQCQFQ